MSLYIVTLAEMKAELGIDDTDDDSVLTEWMEGLQGRFDEFLERTLLRSASETEILDGGSRFIYTKRWPIESVTSIHIASDQDWDNGTVLDATVPDYLIDQDRGKISYGVGTYQWPDGFQNIRVIYAGGYVACDGSPTGDQTAMPDAIRRAFFMQSGYEWRNRHTLGITQISASGAAKQVGAGVALDLKGKTLMPEVEQTLMPFKRV